MEYQVSIRQWGNSLGIRLPKAILTKANIKEDDVMLIKAENEMLVLRKAFRHKTFEERLSEYGGKISVCDFNWGEPEGREIM